jgi:hypothetical protein
MKSAQDTRVITFATQKATCLRGFNFQKREKQKEGERERNKKREREREIER